MTSAEQTQQQNTINHQYQLLVALFPYTSVYLLWTCQRHGKLLTCQDVASKSATSWQQVRCVVVMEYVKRHDTTDTTD